MQRQSFIPYNKNIIASISQINQPISKSINQIAYSNHNHVHLLVGLVVLCSKLH